METSMSSDNSVSTVGMADSALPSFATSWPLWRVVLIRVWAGLLTAFALMMSSGIAQISAADPDERFMYATSTIWKLLSLGAVAFVLWTGGRNVAAFWAIAAGQLVWVIAGILRPQPDANPVPLTLLNLVIFYGPLIVLRPRRGELLRPMFRPSAALLVLALAGAVPLTAFAVHLSRILSSDLGFNMVGLYLILAAMAMFAALRPAGGQLAAPLLAAGTVLVGIAAITFPHDQASAGPVGGTLLVAGGLAFGMIAHRTAVKPSRSSQPRDRRYAQS